MSLYHWHCDDCGRRGMYEADPFADFRTGVARLVHSHHSASPACTWGLWNVRTWSDEATWRLCAYPDCYAEITDATAPAHYGTIHVRTVEDYARFVFAGEGLHLPEFMAPCKLCVARMAPPFPFYATGCKHVDLGLVMIAHIKDAHPDRVVGWNIERARLKWEAEARRN